MKFSFSILWGIVMRFHFYALVFFVSHFCVNPTVCMKRQLNTTDFIPAPASKKQKLTKEGPFKNLPSDMLSLIVAECSPEAALDLTCVNKKLHKAWTIPTVKIFFKKVFNTDLAQGLTIDHVETAIQKNDPLLLKHVLLYDQLYNKSDLIKNKIDLEHLNDIVKNNPPYRLLNDKKCLHIAQIFLEYCPHLLNNQGANNDTPLVYSSLPDVKALRTAKILLKMGANPNITNDRGCNALSYISCYEKYTSRTIDLAKALLQHNAQINNQDHIGSAPLHHACDNANFHLIELFINHGADVNICDNQKITPIHSCIMTNAASEKSKNIVTYLLKKKANPNTLGY